MHSLLIFAAGTAVGSFLNVVIFRYLKNTKPTGRSQCPHCKKQLVWWELIPIFSFIFLQGQCKQCHKSISIQYPLIEFAMGLFSLLVFSPLLAPRSLGEVGSLEFLGAGLLLLIISWLTILAVIDLYTMLLPDYFVIALSTTVLLLLVLQFIPIQANYFPLTRGIEGVISGSLVGTGLLFALWLITRQRGIGLGDVKLMLPLGALLGLKGTLLLLWLAFILGGIVAFWLLVRGKAKLKTPIPFGPFLIVAAILILLIPALPEYFFFFLLGPLN